MPKKTRRRNKNKLIVIGYDQGIANAGLKNKKEIYSF